MQINVDGAMGENCVEYRKFGIDSICFDNKKPAKPLVSGTCRFLI